MKKEFYTIEKKTEVIDEELKNKIEEAEKELAVLAQVVGGDFDMKVKFGQIGQGSYFNPEDSSITLDPFILKENKKWLAEFVAGHEGGHRAITRSLEQIGIKKEKAIQLYDKIGFGYLSNCLEDCADNDWVGKVFEKFKDASDRNYQEQFETQNAEMTTPQIQRLSAMLGYTPKFVSFGSEILRKWATDEYSKELDEAVEKALKKTQSDSQKVWQEIPGKFSKEQERIEKARQRFKIIYEKIWPEFEKIVKMDIDQEKMRQLANEMLKQAQEQQKTKGEKSGGELKMPGLPKQMQDELEKLAKENMEKQLGQLEEQIEKLKKQLDNAGSKEQKQQIKDKIKEMMQEKQDMDHGEKNLVPWDKLSEKIKKKIEEIYNKLPKDMRDELEEKAKKTLQEVDDKLIKEGRGKLAEKSSPLTHEETEEQKAKIEQEKIQREKSKKQEREKTREEKKMKKELEKNIEGSLSEYDKIYKEVAPLVDKLYNRIHKIFLPHRHPRWIKSQPTGQRLGLAKVMQFQADKSLYDKLWEKKTIPQKQDYRISLLVDLSGSMKKEKIEKTFRGVIVLSEVLNRVGIKTEINGFQDELIPYKNFDQNLSPAIRQKMTLMRKEVYNKGEHNKALYNSDGYCLGKVSESLQQNKSKDNFLIVLSDGLPAPDEEHAGEEYDLDKIIERIKKSTRQKLIGVGLGPDTGHVADYYPTSLPNLKLGNMPEMLGALLEDIIKFPAKYK